MPLFSVMIRLREVSPKWGLCPDLRLRPSCVPVGDVALFFVALGAAGSALAQIVTNGGSGYQAALMLRAYVDVVGQEPDMALPANPVTVPALEDGIVDARGGTYARLFSLQAHGFINDSDADDEARSPVHDAPGGRDG
jgi:hypothetical protein